MRINKLDVFVGDILYSNEKETSYWEECARNPIFEYKRPNYLVKDTNVLVIRLANGKYIRPQEINGLIDYLTLKRTIKHKKYDSRIIRTSRQSYKDVFISNLQPVFSVEGYISLDDLKLKNFTPDNFENSLTR